MTDLLNVWVSAVQREMVHCGNCGGFFSETLHKHLEKLCMNTPIEQSIRVFERVFERCSKLFPRNKAHLGRVKQAGVKRRWCDFFRSSELDWPRNESLPDTFRGNDRSRRDAS